MNDTPTISPKKLTDLAGRINAAHDAAASTARTALAYAAECGRLLSEAKELTPHGEWGKWLAANFKGSDRTARDWMRLGQGFTSLKAATVADLGVREALAMLAESDRDSEETADLYDAVEHPTMTPSEWRAWFAKAREYEPGWDSLCRREHEVIEQAWDELTIGKGYALVRDTKYADDPEGFDAFLRKRGEDRRFGVRYHRLCSHLIAWDRYAAGEPDPEEPDFRERVRGWAKGGAA